MDRISERDGAARLLDEVAFDAPIEIADGSGGTTADWGERLICRGSIRYLRGGETIQAARLAGRQPVVVSIRDSVEARAVGTDWRMRDVGRGVVYNIRSIVPSDDRRWLEITAESGVAV
ncbi:head-tail adaptor protein [Cereibacter azotoformans]|uniref:head-tail adaptor protein n=1 Tax=Cereibacter azotoformans TaxID=43057 RepID=UPI000E35E779|nr:head-tail adaptor protein [Cereibacter azotoformans]AXQ93202.1 head-tail adaptor protein [Cereibacter sphaeroides]UIJ31513.1 head-tail adaptor protein [Cereibacter azotoformans]